MGRRDRGDAQVDPAVVEVDAGATILGQASLGDVELGQDLDARDDGGGQPDGRCADLAQPAVDPIADAKMVAIGLDMDVGGLHAERVGQELAHQPHDRRLLGAVDQPLDILIEVDGGSLADVAGEALEGGATAVEPARRRSCDVLGRRGHRHDHEAGRELHRPDGLLVGRIDHREPDPLGIGRERKDTRLAEEAGREGIGQDGLGRIVLGRGRLEPQLLGRRPRPVDTAHELHARQQGAHALAALGSEQRRTACVLEADAVALHQPQQDGVEPRALEARGHLGLLIGSRSGRLKHRSGWLTRGTSASYRPRTEATPVATRSHRIDGGAPRTHIRAGPVNEAGAADAGGHAELDWGVVDRRGADRLGRGGARLRSR